MPTKTKQNQRDCCDKKKKKKPINVQKNRFTAVYEYCKSETSILRIVSMLNDNLKTNRITSFVF